MIHSSRRIVEDDRGVAGIFSHFDGLQGFREGADLVRLDEDRVGDAFFDAFFEDAGVGARAANGSASLIVALSSSLISMPLVSAWFASRLP